MADVPADAQGSVLKTETRRSISPPAISASMAVITFVLTAGWYTALYIQNWERDRATASMEACKDFGFGEGMTAANRFNEVSRYVDPNTKKFANMPLTDDIPGREGTDEEVRNALLTYVNMIDVTATGLDTGVYEPKIIASCLSSNFAVITEALSYPANAFVEGKGHERISFWSEELQKLASTPLQQSFFSKLFQ